MGKRVGNDAVDHGLVGYRAPITTAIVCCHGEGCTGLFSAEVPYGWAFFSSSFSVLIPQLMVARFGDDKPNSLFDSYKRLLFQKISRQRGYSNVSSIRLISSCKLLISIFPM